VVCFAAGCKKEVPVSGALEEKKFTPTGSLGDLVYNPLRADGSLDSSYLPILTLKDTLFDFGTIFEGDVVTKEFSFTNTGTAPLLILKATSTCGCTVPEWPKTPVLPDSTASITVKFNSLHKPGHQTKEVTIFANTFPNQHHVTIKGKVDLTN
jgi:hypothetical protein